MRFSLRFASGTSKAKFPQAERPKSPNRDGEYPPGGKHTETGFDGTTTPMTRSHPRSDRPPPEPTVRTAHRRHPPASHEDATEASRNTTPPRTSAEVLLCVAETELVTSKEDTGHRRFVTEGRARRERPPYPEDRLTADSPTAALLLPSAALGHHSSIQQQRASEPGQAHCPE